MKCSIFPWLANEGHWESGIGIRSMSPVAEAVSITLCGAGFAPAEPIHAVIPPYGDYKVMIPKGYKNAAALVIGSDLTFAIASTWIGSNTYSFVPPIPAVTLGDILQFCQAGVTAWRDSPFVAVLKGAGNAARFNKSAQRMAVELAAVQVFYEFPERPDRALGVMDACPASGDAPGHPVGSHAMPPGDALDISYYTFGKNNTQIGGSPTVIWSGGALNRFTFDKVRTARFFELVKKYLPEMTAMVDDRIAAALGHLPYLQGDRAAQFQHDKHAHIVMGGTINSWAKLCD